MSVVTDISLSGGGDSVLSLGTAFVDGALASEVKSISWVMRHRFEADTLVLEWITDGVAQTAVTIRTLED